jgi:hypothetical protein
MNGVTAQDAAPDNPTLLDTTHIIITGSRGSGVSGRRQPLLINDEMAAIRFTAQNVANGTGNGITASTMNSLMLENATTTTSGASLIFKTVNSGTTSLNIRLYMTDRLMSYQSDTHNFTNAAGAATRLSLNTTANSNTYNSDTHAFNATSGSTPRMTLTTSSNVYNSNIHTFNNQAVTAALLQMTSGGSGATNTYNNDTHNFRNQVGTISVLTISTGTSNYNNDTQNFNNSANTKTMVSITNASGVNFKGYTETLLSAAYTATFAPDVSTATIWVMTLGGNVTFNGFTNPVAGQSASIYFVQDSTGTRILSSTMKFAGGSKILSTGSGATDMIAVTYGGAVGYYASLVKGFV